MKWGSRARDLNSFLSPIRTASTELHCYWPEDTSKKSPVRKVDTRTYLLLLESKQPW